MSPATLSVLLCLISAVTVALVNVLIKRGGDVLVARMLVGVVMAACALPLLFFVPFPPMHTWGLIAISVVAHGFYQIGVVRALHRGDLSLVFPVMRGLGPLAAAVFALFILREQLSLWQTLGLLTASLAIIVFALPTQVTAAARRLDRTALFWAAWTAVGVGLYSVCDARAVRAMDNPLSFVAVFFVLDAIGISAITLWQRGAALPEAMYAQWKPGLAAGLAGFISYSAALYAFSLTDAALVTALRETSVVFAAAMGAVFLKEGFGRRRIAAASALAAGLVALYAGAG